MIDKRTGVLYDFIGNDKENQQQLSKQHVVILDRLANVSFKLNNIINEISPDYCFEWLLLHEHQLNYTHLNSPDGRSQAQIPEKYTTLSPCVLQDPPYAQTFIIFFASNKKITTTTTTQTDNIYT